MKQAPLVIVALLAALPAAVAQSPLGRYSMKNPDGATITLTLESAGTGKLKGTLVGNGLTFTIEGEVEGADASGTMRGSAGTAFFEATREGAELQVVLVEAGTDGRPNLATARELVFAVDESVGAKPRSAQQGSPKAAPSTASSPRDRQISQLLLSSAWCTFSYSGGSTYTGGTHGRSTSGRVVFSSNGWMQQSTSSEMSNSGAPGQVYSNNAGGQSMRWKVENAALLLSADGAQWETVQLVITQNSNGYPIVKADGVEYYQCR